jgi:HSP20 family protein
MRHDLSGRRIEAPFEKGGDDMATIVRWSPFRELDSIEHGMRRMFSEFGFVPAVVPAADVYETNEEFVVELEVPGFVERELGIEITDHTLVVKGERTEVKEEKEEKEIRLRERLEEKFERRFFLPTDADTEQLKATFTKGVLEVHAPKLPTSIPHQVEITKA